MMGRICVDAPDWISTNGSSRDSGSTTAAQPSTAHTTQDARNLKDDIVIGGDVGTALGVIVGVALVLRAFNEVMARTALSLEKDDKQKAPAWVWGMVWLLSKGLFGAPKAFTEHEAMKIAPKAPVGEEAAYRAAGPPDVGRYALITGPGRNKSWGKIVRWAPTMVVMRSVVSDNTNIVHPRYVMVPKDGGDA